MAAMFVIFFMYPPAHIVNIRAFRFVTVMHLYWGYPHRRNCATVVNILKVMGFLSIFTFCTFWMHCVVQDVCIYNDVTMLAK